MHSCSIAEMFLQSVLIYYQGCFVFFSFVCSAEGKPISKKALKKQQKDAEKAKRKAETAARLVRSLLVTAFVGICIREMFDSHSFTKSR